MQEGVKIILVETSHPGNIGSAARALKTMGQTRFCLVNPKSFPSAEATALASGADDILAQAQVFSSVAEAVADCTFCFGVSARQRSLPLPVYTPKMAAEEVTRNTVKRSAIAVLFGRERVGLTNEEIDCCHALISIPANPAYSSLNLAMAVQIVAYELWQAEQEAEGLTEKTPLNTMATDEEMRFFYQHLESTLVKTEFLEPENPKFLMRRLKRLFNRSQPDKNEINILRGFLTSIEKSIREK